MTPAMPMKGRWGLAPDRAKEFSSDPLGEIRQKAFRRFEELGFPTLRHEEWKYTNLKPIADADFARTPETDSGADPALLNRLGVPAFDAVKLVFKNGHLCRNLSTKDDELPTGITVESLGEAGLSALGEIAEKNSLVALNTAFFQAGTFVRVSSGTKLAKPIHLCFVSDAPSGMAVQNHPRVRLELGEKSELTVVESYWGTDGTVAYTNGVTEIAIAAEARLVHALLQTEANTQFQTHFTRLNLQRASHCDSVVVTLGGRLVRNDLEVCFAGPEAVCRLDGVSLVGEGQHVDNHTLVDHAVPHCQSAQTYKNILDGNGTGVFNGKILVRPDAQQTDAQQSNRNLLLSADATMNTRPQLEIYADEVKCTHGATVGRIEENALFYLKSRGIDAKSATAMLTRAFAAEIFSKLPVEALRSYVEQRLAGATKGAYEI